ncbi:hypothetical protein [Burkholderia sp. BCC0405]|uniref:hypothetical protein n=1 Tax=Burkholderia sp. BCC0405 TaxID=2676298 RepID=UPI001589343A|nr:hypothetical protein [Burkholderia sp. BCC0405]
MPKCKPAAVSINAMKRDANIIEALHVARYALVIHNGLPFTCEGETHRMDFEIELTKIDAVMTMLGIDLSEPLPAPIKGDDDE